MGGLNLVVLAPGRDGFDAALLTNSGPGLPMTSRLITPTTTEYHCGGMSNAIDGTEVDGFGSDEPWTKVTEGKRILGEILARRSQSKHPEAAEMEMNLVENLMALLG